MLITSRCRIWTDLNRAGDRFFSLGIKDESIYTNNGLCCKIENARVRSLACLPALALAYDPATSRQHANTMMMMSWVIRTDRQIDRSEYEEKKSLGQSSGVACVHNLCRPTTDEWWWWEMGWKLARNFDQSWNKFHVHKQKQQAHNTITIFKRIKYTDTKE